MRKPIIFALDDDQQVLRAITRDLKNEYREEYRVLSTDRPEEALSTLHELSRKGDVVALFLCDQKMPEMLGVEFLEKAKKYYPTAKRVLLTAYSDTDAAIRAINEVKLDYYLMKPWDPPVEKLFPVISDQLEEWSSSFRPEYEGIRVLGYRYSPKSHVVKDFLAGNLFPYEWLDVETDSKASELMMRHKINPKSLPAVIFEDAQVFLGSDIKAIAEKVGLTSTAKTNLYDVVIIGAGPAGLAAGVYGGSEGLNTLLIEKRAPGGQAGMSSRIENYLGFPNGLSGSELSRRAITQATRFGIEFLSPQSVTCIETKNQYKLITLADGSQLNAKTAIITTGVEYRKLEAKGIEEFTGAGIYYGAATIEANSCQNHKIFVIGGGNSAGQGAVYLSKYAENVYISIRKDSLKSSMSSYLIDQINSIENIHVLPNSEVLEVKGEGHLEKIILKDLENNEEKEMDAAALFVFIGARPYTEWVPDNLLTDRKGFILTGKDLMVHPEFKRVWKLIRSPHFLETSIPGIFAAGDVRAGAMNRVASAVGEGAMAISFVHQALAEI